MYKDRLRKRREMGVLLMKIRRDSHVARFVRLGREKRGSNAND